MPARPLSAAVLREALLALKEHGSLVKGAEALGMSRATFQSRVREARVRRVDAEDIPLGQHFEEAWRQWRKAIGMAKDRYQPPTTDYRHKTRRKILVIPDLHAPFHEEAMFAAMLEREADADHVICIGDVGDSYALSRFVKYARVPYRDEWASVNLVIQELANRFPRVTMVIGNHDARLERQIRERLTEDMVDAIRLITGGILCPITAIAKRYQNVEIARHEVPGGDAIDWCVSVGDAWLGHPEKFSVTPGAVLRKVEEWLSDNEMAMGFDQYKLIVVGHTHQYAQIPWRSNQLLVECGAMCKTQGYMTSPRIGGRPQRRGYLVFNQADGITDLNSVRFRWMDVEQTH
jgi:predicted phosphodiesterase